MGRIRSLVSTFGLETGARRMSLAGMTLEGLVTFKDYPVAHAPLKGRDDVYPIPLPDTAILALKPWRDWLATPASTPTVRPRS